jgi:hypothetical protein
MADHDEEDRAIWRLEECCLRAGRAEPDQLQLINPPAHPLQQQRRPAPGRLNA